MNDNNLKIVQLIAHDHTTRCLKQIKYIKIKALAWNSTKEEKY